MSTNERKQTKFFVSHIWPGMIDVTCSKCGTVATSLHNSEVELVGEKIYLTKKEVSCHRCGETIPAGMLIAEDKQSLDDFSFDDSTVAEREAKEQAEQAARVAMNSSNSSNSSNEKNTVASVLQVYAIINAICGLFLALSMADYYSGAAVFLLFAATLVASGFIYALGEVIKLLHEIKLNTRKTEK